MLAFAGARKALLCAVVAAADVRPVAHAARRPLPVRMGLHTGEVIRDGDDLFGRNVILASRIAAEARGGEILVSSLTKELTDSHAAILDFSDRPRGRRSRACDAAGRARGRLVASSWGDRRRRGARRGRRAAASTGPTHKLLAPFRGRPLVVVGAPARGRGRPRRDRRGHGRGRPRPRRRPVADVVAVAQRPVGRGHGDVAAGRGRRGRRAGARRHRGRPRRPAAASRPRRGGRGGAPPCADRGGDLRRAAPQPGAAGAAGVAAPADDRRRGRERALADGPSSWRK